MPRGKKGALPPRAPLVEPEQGDELPQDRAPNATPDILFASEVDDLYLEATNWLDGEPIANQAQADELGKLIARLEKLAKDADKVRAEEKAPHLEAGRAVDAKWKPITEKAGKAVTVGKRALTPWLQAVKAEQDRIAAEKRKEAEAAAERLRQEAEAARQSSDLRDEDTRELAEREAKEAKREANRAERETAVVRGEGRSIGLRTFWLVNVKDHRELLTHYLRHRPDVADALKAWLYDQAQKDVRGGARTLPGCSIWSEERAV